MKMVEELRPSAAARGHAGMLPISAKAATENNRIAQAITRASTKREKLRGESKNQPQRTGGNSPSSERGVSMIGARGALESIKCSSADAKIESRPEIAAAESIWVSNQSFRAFRVFGVSPQNCMPPWPLLSAQQT